ncbi:MAG: hypothetical protein ACXVRI_13265, partial [Gaiellaceae bacterium]
MVGAERRPDSLGRRTISLVPGIGFFVFDGMEELDWAGPWEVLSAWAHQWPEDGVTTTSIGRGLEAVV